MANEMKEILARIRAQASAEDALKASLNALQTPKQQFEAFSEAQEKKAEEILIGQVAPNPAQISVSALMGRKLVDYVSSHQISDDLGADIEPDPDGGWVDNDAITTIYEEPEENSATEVIAAEIEAEIEAKELGTQESFSLSVVLNEKQLAAKEMAFQGKSFCLVGAAGTGKTTATRAIAEALLEAGQLATCNYKTYDGEGQRAYKSAPSIAFCAFTRRAAANLQKAIHKSPILAERLKHNIMTIHSLLEFEPETYFDPIENKDKFRFAPKRTAENPLTITHLVIEEASMLDAMTLWGHLYEALPSGIQIIFIGDINQLPPVFGPSILNYALVQLPIVELTEVYRNQGIVLENAHRILAGKELEEDPNFVVVRGKQKVQTGMAKTATVLGTLFNQWLDIKGSDGLPEYDPDDCIILSPMNVKELGTDNLNKWIAQHLGVRRNAIVHEVIAGFHKHYLAVGDRVMFNKLDGVIKDIYRNPNYHGKEPQIAGSDLTRFGMRILGKQGNDSLDDIALDYSNFSLEALEAEKAERKMQCSHTIVLEMDNGKIEELSAAGDLGPQSFSLGYALTVHKAQGSEWRKVFIILHKDMAAVMFYRELFYTAVTRARTKVTIISKDEIINKCIKNQRIKGNSMADKIEYFNSGIFETNREPIYATKD